MLSVHVSVRLKTIVFERKNSCRDEKRNNKTNLPLNHESEKIKSESFTSFRSEVFFLVSSF